MSSRQDVVRSHLRPSENLQCLLDVELATHRANPHRTDPTTPVRRRLIAVVTHRFNDEDTEVGSILVLKALGTDSALKPNRLAQVGSKCSHGVTVLRDAQDTRPIAFAVRTEYTQNLRGLTAECRRLKEIAATTHPVDTDFAWVDAYISVPPSRQLDLRLRKQPLLSRLSRAIAGLPGDDVSDILIVRHDWIEQVATKEASSGNVKHLKIRLGTFNVNGKSPSQDLYPWIRSPGSESQLKTGWISPLKLSPFEFTEDPFHRGSFYADPHSSHNPAESRENNLLAVAASSQAFGDPDVLVLGFQELDLSTEALLYTTNTLKEDEWLTAIFAGLGEKRVLYEKLTSRQLVGMLLVVIVKKVLVSCFTNVRSCDAGSGIMGFMGNKGATAIRLEFTPKMLDSRSTTHRPTTLTFVNAHLAASDEMVDRRNYDFQELSTRLTFSPNDLNGSYSPTSSVDTYTIYQSDVLFWMGGEFHRQRLGARPHTFHLDLNYRLDLPDGDVRELLFSGSHMSGIDGIESLLLCDQLKAAMRSNKAFSDFTEHPITYLPTYRLPLGASASKDRMGYDVRRKPAWTDRILYMSAPDMKVSQVAYRSHPEITMSDHQPVSADCVVSLPLVDRLQYGDVVSALHRDLAGFEDSERKPKIKIRPISIDFGVVKYQQAIHREVVIQNEGDTPCVFRFVGARANVESIAPSWLRIEPKVGLLRPNDTMTILLSAYIDNDSAARLNVGLAVCESTLILHTALGKDDFISVSGNYQYTCFANTLERLTRLAGPIRTLKSPDELLPAGQAKNAPTEIMRLINWMMTHVSATDALFEYPAQQHLCHVIRECLDTGDEFPGEGPDRDHRALVAAFSSTLVALLDSLIEPVVPSRLHTQCLQARDKEEAFEVLDAFPHESINVWISLTALLHFIAQQGPSKHDSNPTGATMAHRLASIFSPVLLRDDPTGVHPSVSPLGKRGFLLHFIA